jgi:hypothetical protein
MAAPHPALIELASGRRLPPVGDGKELLRSAREHRVAGLLWSRVLSGELSGERSGWDALAGDDLLERAHHRRLWATLSELDHRLSNCGIEVAAAKGVAAEARWYDRQGERPCVDLDLLVNPHHLDRVGDAVELIQPDHPLRGRVQELVDHGLLQSIELQADDGSSIDLHIDVLKLGIPSQRELIWQRTVPVAVPGGGTVRALDPETSLVHFLLHLTKDRFRFLLGFVDIARILERETLDHAFIDGFVRAEGLEVHYQLALEVVARTLGSDVGDVRGAGGRVNRSPHNARAVLWRIVWRPAIRLQGELGAVRFRSRQLWIPLTARGRWGPALRHLARRLFPTPVLVDYRRPGVGHYLWRLNRGRWQDSLRRRRAAARLRLDAGAVRSRGEAPSREGG